MSIHRGTQESVWPQSKSLFKQGPAQICAFSHSASATLGNNREHVLSPHYRSGAL